MISRNFYNSIPKKNSVKLNLCVFSRNKNTAVRPFANHYVAKPASYSYHHMKSECLFFIQKRYNTTFKDAKKQQVIKKILKLKKKI